MKVTFIKLAQLSTKSSADISEPEQISKSSLKISQVFFYIISLLQLASKCVLLGPDCLKIDGVAPDVTGEANSALPDPLAALKGEVRGEREEEKGNRKGGEGEGRGREGNELVGLGLSPHKVFWLRHWNSGCATQE